jgi:hypothetical protein
VSEPTCIWCGEPLDLTVIDVSALGPATFRTIRGRYQCSPFCVPRCPTCKREPGDIHGGQCAEIILRKYEELNPCVVTRADCGQRRAA